MGEFATDDEFCFVDAFPAVGVLRGTGSREPDNAQTRTETISTRPVNAPMTGIRFRFAVSWSTSPERDDASTVSESVDILERVCVPAEPSNSSSSECRNPVSPTSGV